MNRRKFLASTGTISLGGGFALNALSRSALAFEVDISSSAVIPENVSEPQVKLEFGKFEIIAKNIEYITIELRAGIEGEELTESVDSTSKKLDNPNGVNDLTDVSLFISNGKNEDELDNGLDFENTLDDKEEGDILDLTVEVIIKGEAVEDISTGKNNISILIESSSYIIVDNFEYEPDGPYGENESIHDYWNDFDGDGVDVFYRSTESPTLEGNNSLHSSTSSFNSGIISTPGDGLPYYPDVGDEIYVDFRSQNNEWIPIHIGADGNNWDNSNSYEFMVYNGASNELRINVMEDGSRTLLDSETHNLSPNTSYTARILYRGGENNNQLELEIFNNSNETKNYLSAKNTTYNNRGIALRKDDEDKVIYDNIRVSPGY